MVKNLGLVWSMLMIGVFLQYNLFCQDSYVKKYWDKIKSANASQTIEFYGKIIDKTGKPIGSVSIEIRITKYSTSLLGIKPRYIDRVLISDKNGNFSISARENMKGATLSIKNIEKNGYEWSRPTEMSISAYDYRKDGITHKTPTRHSPAIFHMREKSSSSTYLLLCDEFMLYLRPGGKELYSFIDLEESWENSGEDRNYKKDFLPKYYDFLVSSTFDKGKSDWIVIFKATGKNGGFVLSGEALGEAPKNGYKKIFKFIQHVPTEKEEEMGNSNTQGAFEKFNALSKFKLENEYLYVRSREPAIYTRIKLTGASIDSDEFNLFTRTATNPYGERNLEAINDELPSKIRGPLFRTIKKTFLQKGKRPPKPDIKKMLNEYKKTHKRVKDSDGDWEWVEK